MNARHNTIAALALFLGGTALSAGAKAAAPLLTPAQVQDDKLAAALRDDPAVTAARARLLRLWQAAPQDESADGRATLAAAVDEAVNLSLRDAVADPDHPAILWTLAPAYRVDGTQVPSSRNGDSPDRIYRFIALNPQDRYVIHGQRSPQPSLKEFSLEAETSPAAAGKALFHLDGKDIDVAGDGSFTVDADGVEAPGRRNHLYLPPGTTSVLIRDTLLDWGTQLPNLYSVDRLGGPEAPALTPSRADRIAAADIADVGAGEALLEKAWRAAPNRIVPFLRPLAFGMPGNGVAITRFDIPRGEALVVTLDTLGGDYLGFAVADPWGRTVNYWSRNGSLNNQQAEHNADGTITYVISASDPGVANWLDDAGLRSGLLFDRWENLAPGADIHDAVRDVRLVPLARVPHLLPEATRVSPAERQHLLAARQAGFARRLAQS